jgi:hypothetical protein
VFDELPEKRYPLRFPHAPRGVHLRDPPRCPHRRRRPAALEAWA